MLLAVEEIFIYGWYGLKELCVYLTFIVKLLCVCLACSE